MRLKLIHAASTLVLGFAIIGPATSQGISANQTVGLLAPSAEASVRAVSYDVSSAAMATAVTDANGVAVPAASYATYVNAVKAGDMAAFLTLLKEKDAAGDEISGLQTLFLALDEIAADDYEGARDILRETDVRNEIETESQIYAYVDAWLLALEGKPDQAVERHRGAYGALPGLVGDLSLAAMLDAVGRPEQALAVYESITPARIEAPEHEFDSKGLLFSHIRTVIARHALLLQRMGRVEEAKAAYQKLADAEPEQAASYAAAMESLETGDNLDNDPLTIDGAFSQSLSDLSRSLYERRVIQMVMIGARPDSFDADRSAFDQMALLIYPEDEGLRSAVIDQFYEEALFDSVAHTALSAPETSANLQISAAQAYVMLEQKDKARAAIDVALDVSDDEDRLQTLYGALQLRTMLDDRDEASKLIGDVIAVATNTAEKAAAHALASDIYSQFGELQKAADAASKAREIDDTHDRRMLLANALGKAGDIDGALKLLRSERLARPNDPYTLNSLGYFLLLHTDRYEEAYKVLGRANALAENDAYIADSFGWARFMLGDLKGAQRMIEFARAELLPHAHWEIEDHLGDIYWHKGREADAREAWQNALDNRPPDVERASIAEKLANGISVAPPKKQRLPDISIDEAKIDRRKI